jgi:hypothetical protein
MNTDSNRPGVSGSGIPSPDPAPPKPQRDARGYFAPGNTLSRCTKSPHASKVVALRAEMFRTITPDKWREIILAMHKEAVGVWDHLEGKWAARPNVRAAEWIADRLVGKPVEAGAEDRLRNIEEALGLPREFDPEHVADILDNARREGDSRENPE